jgi:tRNA U34 5-methylaminomethyl-2-thiouridine-forming methyltransferase MnmC
LLQTLSFQGIVVVEIDLEPLPRLETGDGSWTFYSPEFKQAFHNLSGARQEALEKFVLPCHLVPLAQRQSEIHLLDICFGLGYNSGVAWETIADIQRLTHSGQTQVQIIGLERSPGIPQQAVHHQILFGSTATDQAYWARALQEGSLTREDIVITLLWGDARTQIQTVPLAWADAVFLDPFSPSVCPELWTVEFLQCVAQRMKPMGRLTTYSCAASVRTALQEAGFHIGSTSPVGRPWPGTVASPSDPDLPPLSPAEIEHLQTRAAIPYRDPDLAHPRDIIRQLRQAEQQKSSLEPTSAWKRRWAESERPI